MGTNKMLQQAQDIYWFQPQQFIPLDQQVLFPGPQVVQRPAATAGAPGQQAQDAVTMATAMWRMMSSVLQQQQRMVYSGYGPGTPRTPLHQNAGTPVGMSRCPGGMATPRFSAPTPVHTTPPGMPLVAASMAFSAGMANQDTTSVLPQHSGQKQQSSQDTQDSESPASDSRPTAFTLDPLMAHRLPADIDKTSATDMYGRPFTLNQKSIHVTILMRYDSNAIES